MLHVELVPLPFMAKRNRHKRRKGNASDGPANVESSKAGAIRFVDWFCSWQDCR